MRILSFGGSKHFCQTFNTSPQDQSMKEWYSSEISGRRRGLIREGEDFYRSYQSTVLREADRSLLLGIACFRRSFDIVSPASSFWLQVTLYYAGWFAARAILGILGTWCDGNRYIEVSSESPGEYEFVARSVRGRNSSHQRFWTNYYNSVGDLESWVPDDLMLAIQPPSDDPIWATNLRNRVNYDPRVAFQSMENFREQFDASCFPTTLPGSLSTQFNITESLLLYSAKLAQDSDFATDVYSPVYPNRAEAIRELVFNVKPYKLERHAQQHRLIF